jgi:hypothetical protein
MFEGACSSRHRRDKSELGDMRREQRMDPEPGDQESRLTGEPVGSIIRVAPVQSALMIGAVPS